MNNIYDEIDKALKKYDNKKIDKHIEEIKKEKPVVKEEIKPVIKEKIQLDTIQEQIESPMTTSHCEQAIKEDELKLIDKNPENYIEINFIKKIRIVDSFYIPSNLKKFKYGDTDYFIDEEIIYILPTKKGYFMPTCFYREGISEPVDFKQKNAGISGKALSLLYDPNLYQDMFSEEEGKYNLFIVLLLIASISSYLVGIYFLFNGVL